MSIPFFNNYILPKEDGYLTFESGFSGGGTPSFPAGGSDTISDLSGHPVTDSVFVNSFGVWDVVRFTVEQASQVGGGYGVSAGGFHLYYILDLKTTGTLATPPSIYLQLDGVNGNTETLIAAWPTVMSQWEEIDVTNGVSTWRYLHKWGIDNSYVIGPTPDTRPVWLGAEQEQPSSSTGGILGIPALVEGDQYTVQVY
jgi:hypothetical protein